MFCRFAETKSQLNFVIQYIYDLVVQYGYCIWIIIFLSKQYDKFLSYIRVMSGKLQFTFFKTSVIISMCS